MTEFRIQIHPHRCPQLELASVLRQCERLSTERSWVQPFSHDHGFDQHAYVNLAFETDYPKLLWQLLFEQLYHASGLGQFMRATNTPGTGDADKASRSMRPFGSWANDTVAGRKRAQQRRIAR
jgi:hypothetical protein